MAKRIILSLLGVMISISLYPYAWGQDSTIKTARVLRTKGTTMVYHHDSAEWSVAKREMRLVQSDTIKTLSGSEVDLLIEDIAVIRLKENTTLELAEIGMEAAKPVESSRAVLVEERAAGTGKKNIFKLMKGRVLLWVRYVAQDSAFEVHTSIGVAGVRGTRFMVSVLNEDTTMVAALEGIIEVRNIQIPDKAVVLRAKETSIIVRGAHPSEPRRVSEEVYRDLKETLELRLPRQSVGFKRKPGSRYDGMYSSSNIYWEGGMPVSGGSDTQGMVDHGIMPMLGGTTTMGGGTTTMGGGTTTMGGGSTTMGGGTTTMGGGTTTMGIGSTTVRGGSKPVMREPVRSPVDSKSGGGTGSKGGKKK